MDFGIGGLAAGCCSRQRLSIFGGIFLVRAQSGALDGNAGRPFDNLELCTAIDGMSNFLLFFFSQGVAPIPAGGTR